MSKIAEAQKITRAKITTFTVAAEYPQGTLAATPTSSSHSGTMSYEKYVAGQKNMDMYAQLSIYLFM